MIWLFLVVIAAAICAPLAWFAWHGERVRGRRDAALALHRAQLAELDRDLAEGRLLPTEHAAAMLEVQRRLLADAALSEADAQTSSPALLVMIAAAAPAAALLLYATSGHPDYAARQAAAQAQATEAPPPNDSQAARQDDALIARLRATLATLDPLSDRAREGYLILGQSEIGRGDLPAAIDAWRHALAVKYDFTLAAETAEAITLVEGHVTPEAAAMFRQALAAAPADAPWRKMAEKRMAEAKGS